MLKHISVSAILVLGLAIAALEGHSMAAGDDMKLEQFFRKYLEADLRLRPLAATRLGDHRFDHLLDDMSAAARARWVEHTRQTLEALPRAVEYAKLSRPAQIDYEILRDSLARDLWLVDNIRPFENDPRVYTTCATECVFLLFAQSTLSKAANIKNALARMEQVPRLLEAARENLRTPPRVVTETAIRQNEGAISFYERELFEMTGDTSQTGALKAAATGVVAALRRHQQFLETELLPRASGEGGSAGRSSPASSSWNWRRGSRRTKRSRRPRRSSSGW